MRELGTKGTNAETMGYTYRDIKGYGMIPTFADYVWNKPLQLKNNAGTVVHKHMIIINPNDKTSVYYPLFFGEGNNMDTYKTSGAGYIVASLLEVTSNRDRFTDITLTNASPNLPTITRRL